MAVEAGSETGIFPADATVEGYLEGRARSSWTAERSDADAAFRQRFAIDLSALEPLVPLPHLPGNVTAVSEAESVPIERVYIGNCANGTLADLRQAASILRGRPVHPGTRAIVVPTTHAIWRQAAAKGVLDVFAEAGAIVSTPTSSACFGGSNGILAGDARGSRDPCVREIDPRVGRPHAAPEVPVRRRHGVLSAGELVHPEAIA